MSYRVVDEQGVQSIREVGVKSGKVWQWSEPLAPMGFAPGELYEDWLAMGEAFGQPIIEVKDGELVVK